MLVRGAPFRRYSYTRCAKTDCYKPSSLIESTRGILPEYASFDRLLCGGTAPSFESLQSHLEGPAALIDSMDKTGALVDPQVKLGLRARAAFLQLAKGNRKEEHRHLEAALGVVEAMDPLSRESLHTDHLVLAYRDSARTLGVDVRDVANLLHNKGSTMWLQWPRAGESAPPLVRACAAVGQEGGTADEVQSLLDTIDDTFVERHPLLVGLLHIELVKRRSEAVSYRSKQLGSDHELLGKGVEIVEQHCGIDSFCFGLCLGSTAPIYARLGDPIVGEGLFRSALSKMSTVLSNKGYDTVYAAEYIRIVDSFAEILGQLSWNERSREHEGKKLLQDTEKELSQSIACSTQELRNTIRLHVFSSMFTE